MASEPTTLLISKLLGSHCL